MSRDEFRHGDWTGIADSVLVEGRRVNQRTAEGITGRLAVTTNTGHPQWHGEATWNVRFGERGGVELIANRDAVESEAALQNNSLSSFLAASFDYAPTERLTMIAKPTWRRFTDGNKQPGGRAWLIFTPVPESGIGIELAESRRRIAFRPPFHFFSGTLAVAARAPDLLSARTAGRFAFRSTACV